jgi:hypothetical protein
MMKSWSARSAGTQVSLYFVEIVVVLCGIRVVSFEHVYVNDGKVHASI